ncbi:site-specific DNA-methyltransferase [Dissulfurirhabdus thermomarina]|uniref:Site-specific DNA-methyltransferase n=1 Tax=Dissulfurirhabdus thermomarina TaxID=1765737 RepID=A0A6N9TPA0_DISTH|nr:site-specific DNA-methyltransferase [Dissulfurirhabdus thermomarina]NDY41267.1 site-specific DNA-methyltransferase [Dissulfurirhabdus thermomarina]
MLQVIYWPPAQLRADSPLRRHREDDCRRLEAVIGAYGFRVPILALADGRIIDGHLRVAAATNLGLAEVPVILVDDLSDTQVRALRLALNRLGELAKWDVETLRAELAELQVLDVDLDALGFSEADLDHLLGQPSDDANEPPDPPATPVSRPGDLWRLGDHRLYIGDATDPESYARVLDGAEADMVWTDPPYNVAYSGKAGRIMNDDMSLQDFGDFLLRAFRHVYSALRPGGAIYVAHGGGINGMAFHRTFLEAGFRLSADLVWVKNVHVLSRGDYHHKHELILYGWRPGAPHRFFGGRRKATVEEIDHPAISRLSDDAICIDAGEDVLVIRGRDISIDMHPTTIIREAKPLANEDHPTTKPVPLIERHIRNSSRPGDLVLDPFGGSGSTLIAAHRQSRRARVIELDPKYGDVILLRWQREAAAPAVHAASGRSYEEVADAQ